VVIKAELPDVRKEDIGVTVENNVLTLTGVRKQEEASGRGKYQRIERRFGSFSRSFTLPTSVDSGQIAASYKDGVLTVRLPRREESKPKQISVNVE
jgi:HSP20 family protein